jgi:hypothetical protein
MAKHATSKISPFALRDCALVVLATGISAQDLRELRDGLSSVEPNSIYHHFWGRLLQPQFDEPEYNNDFASWSFHALHDQILAERLSALDATDYSDIEGLRQELIEIIESRLDELPAPIWAQADQRFHFQRSQIVVLDTGLTVDKPEDLVLVVPGLSSGSIFYHFVDARQRTPEGTDDFSSWLKGDPRYAALTDQLAEIDPYFSSLNFIRAKLAEILAEYFKARTHE